MTKQAKVVNENGILMAEILREEACAHCRACEIGRKERVLYPLPKGDYREGDTVEITIADRAVAKASLLAYGLPLFCLLIGLGIGAAVFASEALQALCAGVCALIGLLVLYLTEKKRKRRGSYDCKVTGPGDGEQ